MASLQILHQQNNRNRALHNILIIFIFVYYAEYINLVFNNSVSFAHPAIVDVIIAIGCSLWYLIQYRRKNILSFELLFLPIYILGTFYSDFVLSAIGYVEGGGIGGAFQNAVNNGLVIQKSRLICMIALIVFLLGCIKGNKYRQTGTENLRFKSQFYQIDYRLIIQVLSFLLVIELFVNYLNGNLSTWFSYETGLSEEERNRGLGNIDSICLMATIVEFSRLSSIGITSFRKTISKINKLYLYEIIIISALLFLSGNRNEMLLIFLPVIVAYTIFIRPIPNKIIIAGIIVGFAMMVYSGATRNGNSFLSSNLDLYSTTKDFSLVQINNDFLIEYTDKDNLHLFETLPASVLSGVPFLGPLIINNMGWNFSTQSTYITTENLAAWDGTGLGTSLVGDLYYNGKIYFVVIFMFFFGYAISRSYNIVVLRKQYNIWILIFYIYMVSNAIYYVRQQWDFPIHSMLYDIILLSILYVIFKKKPNSTYI